MAENNTQDYFDDKSEGHVDTREANFNVKPISNARTPTSILDVIWESM